MTYERFFERLETCGGCTGLRNQMQCRYAVVCAHVEGLARKGEVKSSKNFCYPTTARNLVFNTKRSFEPGTAAIDSTAGIGPCNAEPRGIFEG